MAQQVFSIRLLPADIRSSERDRTGEIRIGSFTERFGVYPFAGTVETIGARWLDELRLLVDGTSAVGLPTACNMTWVLYRVGSKVVVHQMLIVPGTGPRLTRSGKVRGIPAYRGVNDEGQNISEWTTTVAAIRALLARPVASRRQT